MTTVCLEAVPFIAGRLFHAVKLFLSKILLSVIQSSHSGFTIGITNKEIAGIVPNKR
jgi:hypothetical protein